MKEGSASGKAGAEPFLRRTGERAAQGYGDMNSGMTVVLAPGVMMTATIKFPMSCQTGIGEDCMTLEGQRQGDAADREGAIPADQAFCGI